MSTTPRATSRAGVTKVAAMAAVVVVLSLFSTPVSGAPKPTPVAPQLSIAVDNGHSSATAGDKLDYVITLTNVGTEDVDDLLVTQSLPVGTSLLSADRDGDKKTDLVQWKVDLKATKKVTFKTSLELAETPTEVLRLASVVCAKVSPKAAPVVCASDSDILPAGEAAAEATQAMQTEAPDRTTAYVAAGVVLTAALVTLVVLRARRRPRVTTGANDVGGPRRGHL